MMRLAAMLLAWAVAGPAVAATPWQVNHADSRLGFTNWWEGEAFHSVFRDWRAETLRFSLDDLEDSRFDIRIDLASVDTGSADGNEAIAQPEWFHLDEYTTARYETTGFSAANDGGFTAHGRLTLKGITRPVDLDLQWQETAGGARLTGSATLDRSRFDVGTGEWAAGDTIALEVKVDFELELTPKSP